MKNKILVYAVIFGIIIETRVSIAEAIMPANTLRARAFAESADERALTAVSMSVKARYGQSPVAGKANPVESVNRALYIFDEMCRRSTRTDPMFSELDPAHTWAVLYWVLKLKGAEDIIPPQENISDEYAQALRQKALDMVRAGRISPQLVIAVLGHDSERLFDGFVRQRRQYAGISAEFADYKALQHPQNSARLFRGFLEAANIDEGVISDTTELILRHPFGAAQLLGSRGNILKEGISHHNHLYNDANTLRDADSISAFGAIALNRRYSNDAFVMEMLAGKYLRAGVNARKKIYEYMLIQKTTDTASYDFFMSAMKMLQDSGTPGTGSVGAAPNTLQGAFSRMGSKNADTFFIYLFCLAKARFYINQCLQEREFIKASKLVSLVDESRVKSFMFKDFEYWIRKILTGQEGYSISARTFIDISKRYRLEHDYIDTMIREYFDRGLYYDMYELAVFRMRSGKESVNPADIKELIQRLMHSNPELAAKLAVEAIKNKIEGVTFRYVAEALKRSRRKPETKDRIIKYTLENRINGITARVINSCINDLLNSGNFNQAGELATLAAARYRNVKGITIGYIDRWVNDMIDMNNAAAAYNIAAMAIRRRYKGATSVMARRWIRHLREEGETGLAARLEIAAHKGPAAGAPPVKGRYAVAGVPEGGKIEERIGDIPAADLQNMLTRYLDENTPEAERLIKLAIARSAKGMDIDFINFAINRFFTKNIPAAALQIAVAAIKYKFKDITWQHVKAWSGQCAGLGEEGYSLEILLHFASAYENNVVLSRPAILARRRVMDILLRNDLVPAAANPFVIEKIMNMSPDDFRKALQANRRLFVIFRKANRRLPLKRRFDERLFKERYMAVTFMLEAILPGSINHMAGFMAQGLKPYSLVRFLEAKEGALLDSDIASELDKVMRIMRDRPTRKKVNIDLTAMFKVMDAANAFVLVGQKERLMSVLRGSHSFMRAHELFNAMAQALLAHFAEDFGIEGAGIASDACRKIYMPLVPRIPIAIESISEKKPSKLPLFMGLLKAMLEDRSWEFLEDANQKDTVGRELAQHNSVVKKAMEAAGINTARWLGREQGKRLPDGAFHVRLNGMPRYFTMRPILRNPGTDLFLGDFTDCCLAMNSDIYVEGAVERLTDEGMNTLEVIDNDTGKTFACAWLYLNEDGSLVVQNIDIGKGYDSSEALKHKVADELIAYAQKFAEHTGAPRLLIGIPGYSKYFDHEHPGSGYIERRFQDRKIRISPLRKIGGYFGEDYYLDTAGKNEAYLIWTAPAAGVIGSAAAARARLCQEAV